MRQSERLGLVGVLLALWSWPVGAATQEEVPAPMRAVAIHEGPLEIEAGQEWSVQAQVPAMAADERPVLSLKAFARAGGGCNHVLQVLLDGVPLSESVLRRRLINKQPTFDPPKTQFHFAWYESRLRRWMTMFGAAEPITFGGTGRDADFLFDLTGLVAPGKPLNVGFRHAMPELPEAVKKPRAELVVDAARLGVLKEADVARLRRWVEGTDAAKPVPVNPVLPDGAKPGDRAYEVVWSGRKEAPTPQVAFEELRGWSATCLGEMESSVEASVEHRLWRKQLAKLTYGPGAKQATFVLRPPHPVTLEGAFDAANLWLFSDIERMKERHPQVTAHLEDAAGRGVTIDLGAITSSNWVLLHGVLDRREIPNVRFPMRFLGLEITAYKAEAPRRLYLESLAFYAQNRKPFTANTRPAKPAYPISGDGMLPTPPAGAAAQAEAAGQGAVFTSRSTAGTLQYRVEPEKGLFEGITARWNDGPWFQPMAGGEIKLDASGAGTPRVAASALAQGKLAVRWQGSTEWQATYSLRGSTLVVDVACKGGAASGLGFGRVLGLPGGRTVAVPYLTYGTGYGPLVACGSDAFVSVLTDWYHSRCSRIIGQPAKVADGLSLMAGTDYLPLTNGRRNDLQERVLVTVSPEFAEVLPNIPHPPSPHMARLSPYLFVMASYMQPELWRAMKRYGIDRVMTCDFARFYVQDFAEGFAGRWRPHPSLTMAQIQEYRRGIKALGYGFGAYGDIRDWFPLNEFFDENCVSLTPEGDLEEGWYGNYRAKPNYLPVLARQVGEKARQGYAPDTVYLDTHSCVRPWACDYETGVPGAGVARDQIYFNGDCMLESRKWYGSTVSEGAVRWMYSGICDIDYASLFMSESGAAVPLLVDFDLRKIHPLNIGTMMGYGPSIFFRDEKEALGSLFADKGGWPAPAAFHHYVCASLAYGHSVMLGYSYLPPLSRMIQYYALMQGIQQEYLTDRVAAIEYHNGKAFVPTSQALRQDSRKLGRLRVRYRRGLTVCVNYNAEQHWNVDGYDLPPYGWLITKPGEILAFSAQVDGRRVDYTRCRDYVYLNAGDRPTRIEAVEAQGAVWLKREGKGWRLIPCGNLGPWEQFPAAGLPEFHKDLRLKAIPADRGCGAIALDTRMLLGKAPATARVQARDDAGKPAEVRPQVGERLTFAPGPAEYLVE